MKLNPTFSGSVAKVPDSRLLCKAWPFFASFTKKIGAVYMVGNSYASLPGEERVSLSVTTA